jgi:peptidase inhibitor family I36
MMRKRLTWISTVVSIGIMSAGMLAQPRWGRPSTPRTGACFYRDADFRGEYFCTRVGEDVPEMPEGMNDQISSIRIFGDAEVTIFQDVRFRGRSERYHRDVRNLGSQGWNDRLSSISVRGGEFGGGRPPEWGDSGMPREGACFFSDANFRGRSFCLQRGRSYSSLPEGFNDRISSIRVQRARVTVFADSDFRGKSEEIRADVANVGDRWNDKISSVRVY